MRLYVEHEEGSSLVRGVELLKKNDHDRTFNANNPI